MAALLGFAILLIIILTMWPEMLRAVTETVTETTHITVDEKGEEHVKSKDIMVESQNVTFWHVVGTVAIPISGGVLIAAIGFLFNRKQREREEAIENQQAQDKALQAYLDQMSDLLVNQHLRSLPTGSDIHRLAEARTLEALLGLDKERKRRPLKLVYGLGLIKNSAKTGETNGTLLDLENLSLDHADLTELSLRRACLRSADLRAADLQGADLSESNLSIADLRGANLTNADLSNADLSRVNLLPYNEQNPAKLSLHNLKDHALASDEELRRAKRQEQRWARLERRRSRISRLTRIPLDRLTPTKSVLSTNLTDTKLAGANLTGAILANADLRSVRGLTQEQVDSAIGNKETKLPKHLIPPKAWEKGKIEEQIKATYKE